ncbi:MAG: LysR family transcriptional regulator [Myxococcaceae bacterium]
MDRLESMGVFVRVAEQESFTAAAKSLGLPKATVSTAVSRLEARLGARLLQRTTRRVKLTPDGALFYERCKDLLADAEDVETLFQEAPRALTGRIRFDLPSRMARLRVIPWLAEFLDEHPGLHLELGATDRRVDLVREGYDCVVRAGPLSDSSLVARKLGELPLINVVSPAYLERFGRPRRLEDLRHHQLVHYVPVLGGKVDGFEYEVAPGEWKELPMAGRVTVNNAETLMAACLAGLGLVQVPRHTLDDDLKSGRLVEVLPRHRARSMPVHLVFPHRRQLSRRVRAFADWLEKRLAASRPME